MINRLKSFLFVIIGFFVLITIVGLLMPSRVVIARSISIHSSVSSINNALSPENWKNWNPLVQDAESLEIKNVIVHWTKQGHLFTSEIKHRSDSAIRFSVRMNESKEMLNDIVIRSHSGDNDAEVEWISIHQLKWYPWEKFSGLLLEKASGASYDTALNRLRTYVEPSREN